jgi:hypothetical protein
MVVTVVDQLAKRFSLPIYYNQVVVKEPNWEWNSITVVIAESDTWLIALGS